MKNPFSNYYRKITEGLPRIFESRVFKESLSSYVIVVLLVFAVFLGLVSYLLAVKYKVVQEKREQAILELSKWERVVVLRPNYPDAYFQAAYTAFELKDKEKALMYLQKALLLDPEFKQAEMLMDYLTRDKK